MAFVSFLLFNCNSRSHDLSSCCSSVLSDNCSKTLMQYTHSRYFWAIVTFFQIGQQVTHNLNFGVGHFFGAVMVRPVDPFPCLVLKSKIKKAYWPFNRFVFQTEPWYKFFKEFCYVDFWQTDFVYFSKLVY
jgi:hypothetical protein